MLIYCVMTYVTYVQASSCAGSGASFEDFRSPYLTLRFVTQQLSCASDHARCEGLPEAVFEARRPDPSSPYLNLTTHSPCARSVPQRLSATPLCPMVWRLAAAENAPVTTLDDAPTNRICRLFSIRQQPHPTMGKASSSHAEHSNSLTSQSYKPHTAPARCIHLAHVQALRTTRVQQWSFVSTAFGFLAPWL